MSQSLLTECLQFTIDDRILVLNSAADPAVAWLARQPDAGALLLAEDNLSALAQVQAAALQSKRPAPHHVSFHEYSQHEPPENMDLALMNILYQPNNAWMYYGLSLAAYALKAGGRLYVEGAKDRGILSLAKRMQDIFGYLETLKIGKGQRVIYSIKRSSTPAASIEPVSPPFAEGKMDEGTSLLLEAMEVRATDNALDIGCGAGFIGTHIASKAHKGHVTMVDVSLASIDASRELVTKLGLTNAQVLASDGVQAVRDQRFDLIATNPPFHVGGIQTTTIAERFIQEAATVLHPRGRFYIVANRFLKYEPTLRASFTSVEEVGGNTRFKVLRATR